ncbi:MAG: hypothetical protein U9Q18_03310 [Caldisericota bacterium]|nr:hypothetical protein [Caldisericota bacterium]
MKGNFIMEEMEKILPQKSKTLARHIFDWRFILEVVVAVVFRVLYSSFLSSLWSILYAKMPSSSTADVLMMFFDFLFIALTLTVLFFYRKKGNKEESLFNIIHPCFICCTQWSIKLAYYWGSSDF